MSEPFICFIKLNSWTTSNSIDYFHRWYIKGNLKYEWLDYEIITWKNINHNRDEYADSPGQGMTLRTKSYCNVLKNYCWWTKKLLLFSRLAIVIFRKSTSSKRKLTVDEPKRSCRKTERLLPRPKCTYSLLGQTWPCRISVVQPPLDDEPVHMFFSFRR